VLQVVNDVIDFLNFYFYFILFLFFPFLLLLYFVYDFIINKYIHTYIHNSCLEWPNVTIYI